MPNWAADIFIQLAGYCVMTQRKSWLPLKLFNRHYARPA